MKYNWIFRIGFVAATLFLVCCSAMRITKEDPRGNGIIFPRGIMVNVGQVGWMVGHSDGDEGGPWRAGIRRNFEVRDYEPIVEIGQEMGVRFMTLFILGEFDRLNILGEYPWSNPAGEDWDNSHIVGRNQLEIMDYAKNNTAHMEFGITGVLHEHWENGVRNRAEWYDVENQRPRDEKIIRKNVELIKRLMAQYGITQENGHSFPESFIAYGFYYNPGAEYSLGRVLSDNGIKYANTRFVETMHGLDHPGFLSGDFDNGVLLLDRYNHGNDWFEYAKTPQYAPEDIRSVIVESHWANWLAYDDHLQPELNERWIDYLRSIQAYHDTYLAKNTEQVYSQWLYKRHATVSEDSPGRVSIDNRSMPDDAYRYNLLGNMVLAVQLGEGEHVSRAVINGNPVASYYEAEGYGYIYLPPLERENYVLEYETGPEQMERFVNNTGTYNIYGVSDNGNTFEIEMKMYGRQTVEVHSPSPRRVTSDNDNLRIISYSFDTTNSVTHLEIEAHDIQGETGTVVLHF